MEPDTQHLSFSSPPGELRGAKGRIITGGLNIACGIADVVIPLIIWAVGLIDIGITWEVVAGYDPLSIGIFLAILAITAGCIGIFSRRGQCQTVTYLVICVVLAIFTAAGTFSSASLTGAVRAIQVEERYGFVNYGHAPELGTIYTFLILNTIANALHCVVAIVGASFTCGAVCCIPDTRGQQQPMSVRPVVLQPPLQQPMGVAGAAMPPAYTYPAMK